jgi:hypothetical protein
MSQFHRPERKISVGVRFTASEWARLKSRARAEDRSLNSLVTRIVRAELDAMDAREVAADE